MEIVQWEDIPNTALRFGGSVLALGNFDGVHLGHQKIIKRTIELAHRNNNPACLLLFKTHPLKLLNPDAHLNLITDLSDKICYLNELGIDYLIIKDFNKEFAQTPPSEFVYKYLVNALKVGGVVIGFDYSYGQGGAGRAADLAKEGKKNGFFVDIIPPVLLSGKVVSSSLIRKLILEGKMEEAAQFLGKFLRRTGRVVRGDGRGKLLGYPTANLSCNPELIYPANGVYLTMTQIDNSCYASLTNVGVKPTFSDNNSLVMETHILNFNGEIYFKEIFIFFLERIRPEKKFANESLLKKQIEEDIQLAYKVIANKYERQLQLNKVTL